MLTHKQLTQLCKIAYKSGNFRDGELPQGWEMIDAVKDTSTGYNGFAVFNASTHEVVIASAGHVLMPQWTKPATWFGFAQEFALDSLSAASIVLRNQEPAQFKSAVEFTQSVLDQLDGKYTTTFVGHSMGSVLSELLAINFFKQGEDVQSISFEGIGAKSVALNMFGQDVVDSVSGKVSVYNLAPNAFTKLTGKEQIGNVFLVEDNGWDSYFNLKHGITSFDGKVFDEDGHFKYLEEVVNPYGVRVIETLSEGAVQTAEVVSPYVVRVTDALYKDAAQAAEFISPYVVRVTDALYKDAAQTAEVVSSALSSAKETFANRTIESEGAAQTAEAVRSVLSSIQDAFASVQDNYLDPGVQAIGSMLDPTNDIKSEGAAQTAEAVRSVLSSAQDFFINVKQDCLDPNLSISQWGNEIGTETAAIGTEMLAMLAAYTNSMNMAYDTVAEVGSVIISSAQHDISEVYNDTAEAMLTFSEYVNNRLETVYNASIFTEQSEEHADGFAGIQEYPLT
jgi:hypothetical protein